MRANNIFTRLLRYSLQHMSYTLLLLGTFSILMTYVVPAWMAAVVFFSIGIALSVTFENIRHTVVETGCKLCRIQHNSLFDGKQRFFDDGEDDEDD